jgi:hypothetical protein
MLVKALPIAISLLASPSGGMNFGGLVASAIVFGVVGGMILWDRRYRRKWQQYRARNWRPVSANLDEGDIVTLRKARSKTITGYQVWFGYDYQADGEQVGVYILPFSGEFPSPKEAEECRKSLANHSVPVHVSLRNPKRSAILDDEIKSLITLENSTVENPTA